MELDPTKIVGKEKIREKEKDKKEENHVLKNKMAKGKIVVKNAVERKSGYLYYIDGEGNLCEAKMAHGRRKSKYKNIRKH